MTVEERFISQSIFPETYITAGGAGILYKMQGVDDDDGTTIITWVVEDEPDFAGDEWATGTPTPVGDPVAGSIIVACEFPVREED